MSAITISFDELALLEATAPKQFKALAEHPMFKTLILDFKKQANAEFIEFSNQTSWEVEGFGTLSLAALALIATSSLPSQEEKTGVNAKTGKTWVKQATPVLYAQQGKVWETLRKIQAGKVAQGETFGLDSASLRAMLEPVA
jgi:O6-methylguanine-DNA--protein-cysteine methyltransferase